MGTPLLPNPRILTTDGTDEDGEDGEATRNRMGEDALLMNLLSKTEDSPKIIEAAMQLFATAEARNEAMANLGKRVDPEYVALLRMLQEVIDSRPP